MSDIASQIAAEHRTDYGVRGWSCKCGHRYGQPSNVGHVVEDHRIEATEAAVRAQIVADIEAEVSDEEEAFASSGLKGELSERWAGMRDAANIARGETS